MLFALYNTLCQSRPQAENTQFGLPASNGSSLWLSIDHNSFPALLLPADEKDIRPDIVLRSVDVEFSRECEIQTVNGLANSGCYSIIRLKEADPDIVRLFLKILEERFCGDCAPATNAEIAENIQEIAAMFSQIGGSPRDLIGLWGELFAIRQSSGTEAAIQSWSSRKYAKFDFVTESFVLDVKTTLSTVPKHRFSTEQLRPVGSYDAYILSLCVVELQAGKTVGEMMDAIAKDITNSDLRSAFLRQCLTKGGRDIYQSTLRLQAYPEEGSFLVYSGQDIPVPSVDSNSPIDNIRFDVDLTHISPLASDARRTFTNFFID